MGRRKFLIGLGVLFSTAASAPLIKLPSETILPDVTCLEYVPVIITATASWGPLYSTKDLMSLEAVSQMYIINKAELLEGARSLALEDK